MILPTLQLIFSIDFPHISKDQTERELPGSLLIGPQEQARGQAHGRSKSHAGIRVYNHVSYVDE